MVQTCAICTKDHAMKNCPSLPGLKAVFKEAEEEMEPVYLSSTSPMASTTNRYVY